jgi:hypothetical protein
MFHTLSDTNAYHLLIGCSTTKYEEDLIPFGLRALIVLLFAMDCSIQMITTVTIAHRKWQWDE